jgi:hypothetical protein
MQNQKLSTGRRKLVKPYENAPKTPFDWQTCCFKDSVVINNGVDSPVELHKFPS